MSPDRFPAATPRVTDPAERFAEHRRRVAQLEFGTPFPAFFAYFDGPLTVTTGTTEQVEWTSWINGDPRIFLPALSAGPPEVMPTLKLLMPGLYVGKVHTDWAEFLGERATGLYDTWPSSSWRGERVSDAGAQIGPGGAYILPISNYIPSIWSFFDGLPPEPPGSLQANLFVDVYQNSGVNRNVNEMAWELHYLGGSMISIPP